MDKRRYEVVIFGATGFTGTRIAMYLAKLQTERKYDSTFAIAGRSEASLNAVLDNIRTTLGNSDLIKVEIISGVSVEDLSSLKGMASQGKVLITAVGPYRLYGENVVRAAIETHTHYFDITGEPEFIEKMILNYDDQAKENKVTVVSACGFDCIPSETGVQWTIDQFKQRFGASSIVTQINGFITIKAPEGLVGNKGTWESLIHGLSNVGILEKVRRNLREKFQRTGIEVIRYGKSVRPRPMYKERLLNKWALLFPGADSSVVRLSQQQLAINGHKGLQPHYAISFTVPSFLYALMFIFFGALWKIMCKFSLTKKLLLRYPSFFSFGAFTNTGPSVKQLEATNVTVDFFAQGFDEKNLPNLNNNNQANLPKPNKKLHTQIAHGEPGYRATPQFVVQSALTLVNDLKNERKIPNGVLTPAAAFVNTDLVPRLQDEGVVYRVIDE
eukprot:TRINITY_DN1313_c0_g2_i1.p1 TRINITY_DN1313_c0_g2~~TRINITY_DN1313_c0_g2_i1.p1  ORF type:complete len:443 (+),score=70.19 TRINITY_DN1313_c0_g2_i1:307-1635(+)